MTSWWRGMCAIFDKESTGTNVRTDRTVSWCAGLIAPGEEPKVEAELINPGVPIPFEASQVHGIYDQHVRQTGNPSRESLGRLVTFLANMVKAKVPIMGMNLAYDFSLLHWECLRHDLPTVEQVAGRPLAPVIDIYVLDKHADPYRPGSRKLGIDDQGRPGLAAHYGVPLDNAHDAVADAIASGYVGWKIAEKYPEIGNMNPYRLHVCQTDWRAEQQVRLQQWLRRGKDPTAVCDPCWPYCAEPTHR